MWLAFIDYFSLFRPLCGIISRWQRIRNVYIWFVLLLPLHYFANSCSILVIPSPFFSIAIQTKSHRIAFLWKSFLHTHSLFFSLFSCNRIRQSKMKSSEVKWQQTEERPTVEHNCFQISRRQNNTKAYVAHFRIKLQSLWVATKKDANVLLRVIKSVDSEKNTWRNAANQPATDSNERAFIRKLYPFSSKIPIFESTGERERQRGNSEKVK